MELARLPFLIIDGQTTGLSARSAELIELGWSFSLDAECIESRLIRPSNTEDVPKIVWRMTGLSPADFEAGVEAKQLWKDFVEGPAAQCGAAVIHYSQFEIPFFQQLHQSVYGSESALPWPILCTYRIAKKLHPELPARSLRALSGHFGYELPEAQRAKSHVAATQKIWKSLLRDLEDREQVRTLEQLQQWLAEAPTKSSKAVSRRYLVEREKRLVLPEGPGVYEMLSRQGKILYIGKATDLRSRVNSYFRQRKKTRVLLKELMTQVADVRVTPTVSALEAALLENDRIKEIDPPYNVSLRAQSRRLFYFSSALHGFVEKPDAEYHWGPFLSEHPFESLELLCHLLRDEEDLINPLYLNFPAEEMKPLAAALLAESKVGVEPGPDLEVKDLYRAAKRLRLKTTDEKEVGASVRRKFARPLASLHHARWIVWLMECRISFAQKSGGLRVLRVKGGQIAEAYDSNEPLPAFRRARVGLGERRRHLDLITYDRLRILSTELGLMAKKGVRVRVEFSPTRAIAKGNRLSGLLGAWEESPQ